MLSIISLCNIMRYHLAESGTWQALFGS